MVSVVQTSEQGEMRSNGNPNDIPLPSNATDIVQVTLIVAKHIGAVEHHDPGIFCVTLEGCG